DALSVLLVVGIGVTAFDYRVGIVSGLLASLSPLLALSGAVPLADAPTCWLRANALLLPVFWIGALLLWKVSWRSRLLLSGGVVIGMTVLVTPLLIRNA